MAHGAPVTHQEAWRAKRVEYFLLGHSFEYIDQMNLQDYSDVIAYQSAEIKAKKRADKVRKMASK